MITVQLKMENVCDEEDLQACSMTFSDMCRYLIEEDGLFSVVNTEDYKIINIEEGKKV